MAKNLEEKLKKIKLIVSDVDGVLTDGKINLIGEEEIKSFNSKEAVRIEVAIRSGIPIVWVTGRKGLSIEKRSKSLGVKLIFKKDLREEEISLVNELKKEFKASPQEILYVGDDWGDLFLMRQFGLSATPKDGSRENKKIAHIITRASGGQGVLSELIEAVMKAKGTWNKYLKEYKTRFLY